MLFAVWGLWEERSLECLGIVTESPGKKGDFLSSHFIDYTDEDVCILEQCVIVSKTVTLGFWVLGFLIV